MAASSAADPWALPEDAAAKYDAFFTICASGGSHVNRTQAGPLFERAELPPQQMAIIWSLSDIDLDGRLNSNEFRVAMHLATLAVAGQPLPSRLPRVLELIARGRAQPIATATARFGAFEPTEGGRSPPPLAFAAGTSLPPIAPHDLAHYRAVYLASEPSRGGGIDGEVGARVVEAASDQRVAGRPEGAPGAVDGVPPSPPVDGRGTFLGRGFVRRERRLRGRSAGEGGAEREQRRGAGHGCAPWVTGSIIARRAPSRPLRLTDRPP